MSDLLLGETDSPATGFPVAPQHAVAALSHFDTTEADWTRLYRQSAADVDSATVALSDAYGDVTVGLGSTTHDLRLQLASCMLPSVRVGRVGISRSTVSSAWCPWIGVCLPVRGEIRIACNSDKALVSGPSGLVAASDQPVFVEYLTDDCQMETVLFEQSAMEAELGSILGMPISKALRFESRLKVAGVPAFSRALRVLHNELASQGGLAAMATMSARLGRLLMAGLLVSQPHNYTEELTTPGGLRGPRPIRNALEFIESNAAAIETVVDIASAVGLSVRALDNGFKRYVGTPPMRYLRQVRMNRAHEELARADPHVTTATSVARKWGFGHYGRFARDYKRRYGRNPAETLRAD
jgi:AraC-like DNA-binding protein